MKINDLLTETPLPDTWDNAIYNDRVAFKTRVQYAKERAEQVGRGSSRVAFKVPYQGRPTILKIAMNRKGAAQNRAEADMLDDYMVRNSGIVIPVIDYDEKSSYPTWIHMEFAQKITESQLKAFFGVEIGKIVTHFENQKRNWGLEGILDKSVFENEYFQRLQDLVLTFDLPPGDFGRAVNWGLYKNKPVIIDIGLTNDTKYLYGF